MTLPATLYPSQLNSVSTTLNGSLAQASTTVTVTTVGNLLPNSSCPYLVMIGPSTGFDSTTEICICTWRLGECPDNYPGTGRLDCSDIMGERIAHSL